MDALNLLKSDHDRVKSLFSQIKESTSRQKKLVIFQTLQNALETHFFIEETVFYPTFKKFPELVDVIDRSFKEHGVVKDLIQQISVLGVESPDLDSTIAQLIESVDQHIHEEEEQLFPEIRKIMKRPEREQLGRHLQAAKQDRTAAAAA